MAVAMGAMPASVEARQRGPNHQVSSPSELGEGATILDVVRHNRDVRNRN